MKLVEVSWEDAEDATDKTWYDDKEMDAISTRLCPVKSIGYLKSQTDKFITIYGDFSPDPSTYGRVTKVPMGMVRNVRVIEDDKE